MYPPGGGPSYTGRNRNVRDGGPTGVQRSYASELREHEALFSTYEHLQGLPRGDAALTLLRKVASMVKPIMRKRGWHVRTLAEFLPAEANLLGLNINRGAKICIRLRYHNNPDLFLPIEQITDTMLHELSHNIWGDHDSNFHRLWDELRDEYETLAIKGFTGEGFLGRGQRLGGRNTAHSPQEVRRLARASAERRQSQLGLANGSGQRLGGRPLHNGHDTRDVITEQVRLRATVNRGCASSRNDANVLAGAQNTFKTQAEENDANDRAIAEALFDLMEAEETAKLNGTYQESPIEGGLSWTKERGLYEAIDLTQQDDIPSEDDQMRWAIAESERLAVGDTNNDYGGLPPESLVSPMTPATQADSARPESLASRLRRASVVSPLSPESIPTPKRAAASPPSSLTPIMDLSEPFNPDEWACEVCTCVNPMQFLACDACGVERSKNVAKKKPRMGYSALPRRPPPEVTMSHSAVPRPRPLPAAESNGPPGIGWNCANCGAFMEHKWWTCSACGLMKDSS